MLFVGLLRVTLFEFIRLLVVVLVGLRLCGWFEDYGCDLGIVCYLVLIVMDFYLDGVE